MNLFGFCVFLIRAYPNLPTSRKRLPGFSSVSHCPLLLTRVLLTCSLSSSPDPHCFLRPGPCCITPHWRQALSLFSSEPLWSLWRGEYSRYRFLSSQQELKGAGKEAFQKYGEGVKHPQRTPLPPSCSAQNYAHLRGPRKPKKPRKRSKKLITVGALETLNFCRTWVNTLSDIARAQQSLPETKTATRHCRKNAVTRRRKRRG